MRKSRRKENLKTRQFHQVPAASSAKPRQASSTSWANPKNRRPKDRKNDVRRAKGQNNDVREHPTFDAR